ncbi:4887_t:CDS:10, partial [Dentiscutata erythropus]
MSLITPATIVKKALTNFGNICRRRILYRTQPFTWKSLALFSMTGSGLFLYFKHEKAKLIEKRKEELESKSAGKPQVGGPFELIDHNGRLVTDKDFLGQFLLVYFGFTHCPDICPEELDKVTKVTEDINSDPKLGKIITPIFISCDPQRDTYESFVHISDFHKDMVGLTGTYEQIAKVAKSYRVYFSRPPKVKPGDEYLVDHSIFFYLMDPNGLFVDAYGKSTTADSVTDSVKGHIKNFIDRGGVIKKLEVISYCWIFRHIFPRSPMSALSRPLALAGYFQPSPTLDRLVKFFNSVPSLDKILSLVQYFSKVLIWFLLRGGRASLAERINNLEIPVTDLRVLLRFFGLFPLIKWMIQIEHEHGPSTNNLLLNIKRMQNLTMLFYYPLEHAWWLGFRKIITLSPERINKIGMWSCRWWAIYVLLQFWHLAVERSLLVRRRRELRVDGDDVETILREKRELKSEGDRIFREILINVGYFPLTLHWSIENSRFPDVGVGIFGTIASFYE